MKKYTNLLLIEAKRFFSRKNIFTIIVCLVAVVALFHFRYESEYEKYPQYDREDIDLFLEEYKVHAQDYLDRIRATQYDMESNTAINKVEAEMDAHMAELEIQRYQKVVDAWMDCQQYTIMAWYYEGKDPRDENKAMELYTNADYSLEKYKDIADELEDQGIYKHGHVDWAKRMAVHKAYANDEKLEPLCHYIPTGAFSIISLFDGKGMVFFAVLCIIFFLNYDAWCKEFEDRSYIITFTLPYSRTQISLARWFVRIILTNMVMLLFAGEMMLLGMRKYGTGLNDYITILEDGTYVAITQAEYLKSVMLYVFVVCGFIVTFVLLISILLKDSVNSLGVFFFFNCLYLLSSDFIHTKYNPIGLLKISDILTSEGLITMGPAMIAAFVYTILALVIMTLVLVYREE